MPATNGCLGASGLPDRRNLPALETTIRRSPVTAPKTRPPRLLRCRLPPPGGPGCGPACRGTGFEFFLRRQDLLPELQGTDAIMNYAMSPRCRSDVSGAGIRAATSGRLAAVHSPRNPRLRQMEHSCELLLFAPLITPRPARRLDKWDHLRHAVLRFKELDCAGARRELPE